MTLASYEGGVGMLGMNVGVGRGAGGGGVGRGGERMGPAGMGLDHVCGGLPDRYLTRTGAEGACLV